jgi:hypothetical protein
MNLRQATHCAVGTFLIVGAAAAAAASNKCHVLLGEKNQGCQGTSVQEDPAAKQRYEEEAAQRQQERTARADALHASEIRHCYESLTPGSSADDFVAASECLAQSPFAGKAEAAAFLKSQQDMISRLGNGADGTRVRQANEALAAKKQPLYWLIVNANARTLIEADGYTFGGDVGTVRDLSAVDVSLITKSRIFGSDETMPLAEMKSIFFQPSSGDTSGPIGKFTVNDKVADDSYQGTFPFVWYRTADHKKWSAMLSITGNTYVVSNNGARSRGRVVQQVGLAHIRNVGIALPDPQTSQKWTADVVAAIAANAQALDDAAAARAASRQQAIAKLKAAHRGDEDSCQGTRFSDGMTVKCQLMDVEIDLPALKESGWLVVNVSSIESANRTILAIRKAR